VSWDDCRHTRCVDPSVIHQGSGEFEGTPAHIEIHATEVLSLRRRTVEIIAHHTGQPVSQVEADVDRDRFLTADDAREYGIVDDVIASARALD
jgi:ATP-dependent Clp protease protease subunit